MSKPAPKMSSSWPISAFSRHNSFRFLSAFQFSHHRSPNCLQRPESPPWPCASVFLFDLFVVTAAPKSCSPPPPPPPPPTVPNSPSRSSTRRGAENLRPHCPSCHAPARALERRRDPGSSSSSSSSFSHPPLQKVWGGNLSPLPLPPPSPPPPRGHRRVPRSQRPQSIKLGTRRRFTPVPQNTARTISVRSATGGESVCKKAYIADNYI